MISVSSVSLRPRNPGPTRHLRRYIDHRCPEWQALEVCNASIDPICQRLPKWNFSWTTVSSQAFYKPLLACFVFSAFHRVSLRARYEGGFGSSRPLWRVLEAVNSSTRIRRLQRPVHGRAIDSWVPTLRGSASCVDAYRASKINLVLWPRASPMLTRTSVSISIPVKA